MSLRRWLSVILMMGLVLALSPLGAQAEPYAPYDRPNYHHPHGNAYGWDGPRHRDFDRHQRDFERRQRYFQRSCMGPNHPRAYAQQVYAAPPAVAYMAPVAPIIGVQPYVQPQPYYSQPAAPGFHGQINF